MRFAGFPMSGLLVLSCSWAVAACAHKAPPNPVFPPPADLRAAPKPQLAAEALGSARALAEYNAAVEAWGDGLAAQVGRLCRWSEEMGAEGLSCPRARTP